MLDECGAVGGMRIGRGNRSTRKKPAPVPLCPPQITHYLVSNPGRRGGDKQVNVVLTIYTIIRGVIGSNLDTDTGNAD
jgi:hypothetical protein